MGYVILFIVLYYVSRFIIRFVWPIAKMLYATNKQMKRMRNQAGGAQQQQYNNSSSTASKVSNHKKGDYIDFVEIK